MLLDWSDYHSSTLAAFCRRAGVWRTERRAALTNWNSQIQEIYAADLSNAFNALDQDLDNILNGTLNSINESYLSLEKKLEGMWQSCLAIFRLHVLTKHLSVRGFPGCR